MKESRTFKRRGVGMTVRANPETPGLLEIETEYKRHGLSFEDDDIDVWRWVCNSDEEATPTGAMAEDILNMIRAHYESI